MPELTPLDILGYSFNRRLRGFDPDQVHEFLSQVASTVEALLKERGEYKHQLHRTEQELASFRERESALQLALVAAQQAAEQTLAAARVEAQRTIDEGHVLCNRLLEETQDRAHRMESFISDLRSRRREARADLLRLVEVLEGIARDDHELEQKESTSPQLALLQRRRNSRAEG